MVFVGIVTDDVEEGLKTTRGVGKYVAVISYTHGSYADRTKLESKRRAVQTEKSRVYLNLVVATGAYMALPVSLVFFYFPT